MLYSVYIRYWLMYQYLTFSLLSFGFCTKKSSVRQALITSFRFTGNVWTLVNAKMHPQTHFQSACNRSGHIFIIVLRFFEQ